jgi:hypothetical protein
MNAEKIAGHFRIRKCHFQSHGIDIASIYRYQTDTCTQYMGITTLNQHEKGETMYKTMTLKCMICQRVWGCEIRGYRYRCSTCRIAQECGLRHLFTTSNNTYEVCEYCLENSLCSEVRSAAY